ncbi:aldehyde oxidase GLOX-like [Macadamia integrifolia]|uniref:aldehyde oxidase GLOX-like n=1 Tax=Macadamia integrifolia TaxID=60698 RepID=UPI001C5277EC|nr:aldehyde oxidase GLOX-like [Macadamia integrifolia]
MDMNDHITSSLFLSLLLFTIVSLPLMTSQTPSSSINGGAWRLLQSSIGISAMHMQLLRNNKVVIFDRTDFGRSNLSLPSGHCRYDTSDMALKVDCTAHSLLYDINSNTFRPLTVQTDTWCSSGAALPNGNLLQTGGFNDGDRVIRLLDSCDDCDSDWLESPNYLSVRRWYATDQSLPDGRVIIIGGRRQFNYEFYPRSSRDSRDAHRLKFLRQTRDEDENNLYPFVHLLPNGHLFIFANTRSISFDYVRNLVVKEFPPITGGDPRNYPSSGSSVLLPLHFSFEPRSPVEAEVLICGGARRGAFRRVENDNFEPACNTCGRLRVTDPDPKWVMEVMPMARVMGDMLLLPTGDVLIINGAGSGTAGWERASEPVTEPVIYSPTNKRFSVMNPSTIPRLYHSSAVLLPDGRILVGGSNPHVYYNFTGLKFPTELSLEAFSPPYLAEQNMGLRPSVTAVNHVLGYGQHLTVDFTVQEYHNASGVSVTMLAPSFTTHSFGMNQRMVVLRVTEVVHVAKRTYRLMAFGPATAEIAPSGYYLLFVLHAGIPSSGVWMKVQGGP